MESFLFLAHWIHLLAAIIWIGTLYFFNFFLMPFLEKTRAEIRTEVFHKLVPLTLWGFRWGALITLLSGGLIYGHRLMSVGGAVFFGWRYGLTISVGGLLGTVMFVNGWFVMHPKQKAVIASAARVAQGREPIAEAAACGRRVVLASRTNLLLSIPTLFFMVAATHYPSMTLMAAVAPPAWFWIAVLAIMGAIEFNALIGTRGATKRALDSLAGALCGGFILLAAFYFLIRSVA